MDNPTEVTEIDSQGNIVHGQDLIDIMLDEVDFIPIVRTAVLDGQIEDQIKALIGLEAFLQWFSILPIITENKNYVMLKGDVDQIWHAAIVNTVLYRHLCEKYIGKFVEHHSSDTNPNSAWIYETVHLLQTVFGKDLNPLLQDWIRNPSTISH